MEQGNNIIGFRQLYWTYQRIAKNRNLKFSLTKSEFRELTKEDCWYCGEEPSQIKKHYQYKDYYLYNGIDRVNNDKGYIYENCVPCCGTCNSMKRTFKVENFINHIRKIVRNLGL